MSLEKLTRNAIQTRTLDAAAMQEVRRRMERRAPLTPEEYEALRALGRAVKSGLVAYDS